MSHAVEVLGEIRLPCINAAGQPDMAAVGELPICCFEDRRSSSNQAIHYSLDENLLKEVDANVGEAQNIAAEVLRKYREHIRNKSAQQ